MSASISSVRVSSGVGGLDEMLKGGFPQGHVVLVLGPPGAGKTSLGLQFLNEGLTHEERVLYLSLEEDLAALEATARQFGWNFDDARKKNRLKMVLMDPQHASNAMKRIMSELPRELDEWKPRRIVVDSVSLLSLLATTDAERREVIFNLAAACRHCGATTVFVGESDPAHPETSRDGLAEYVADGVVLLSYDEDPDRHRVRLAIRVVKMRRTAHLRSRQPYTIGARGMEVDAKAVDLTSL